MMIRIQNLLHVLTPCNILPIKRNYLFWKYEKANALKEKIYWEKNVLFTLMYYNTVRNIRYGYGLGDKMSCPETISAWYLMDSNNNPVEDTTMKVTCAPCSRYLNFLRQYPGLKILQTMFSY